MMMRLLFPPLSLSFHPRIRPCKYVCVHVLCAHVWMVTREIGWPLDGWVGYVGLGTSRLVVRFVHCTREYPEDVRTISLRDVYIVYSASPRQEPAKPIERTGGKRR